MKKLHYNSICPFSRQARVYIKELEVEFLLIKEDYWQRQQDFLIINPAGTLPVLEEPFGLTVVEIYPIIEYLHEKYPNFFFMGEEINTRCEVRRLVLWFNDKFYREVTKLLIDEKVIRLLANIGSPRTEFLRAARINLNYHLNYLNSILSIRSFLVADTLSCSDIAAACHLSIVDYFGEINWNNWLDIKNWYSIIKSRPSFRPLLQERIAGFVPPPHYENLDF